MAPKVKKLCTKGVRIEVMQQGAGPYDETTDPSNSKCYLCVGSSRKRYSSWVALGRHLRECHRVDVGNSFVGIQIELGKINEISDEEVAHVAADPLSDVHFYCRKCIDHTGNYKRLLYKSAAGHFKRIHPIAWDPTWVVHRDAHILQNATGKPLLLAAAIRRHVDAAANRSNVSEAADDPPSTGPHPQDMQGLPGRVLISMPGTSYAHMCLVPRSVAMELVACGYVELLESGRIHWSPDIQVDMQQALLLDRLPDGSQKRALEIRFNMAAAPASVSPLRALADNATPFNCGKYPIMDSAAPVRANDSPERTPSTDDAAHADDGEAEDEDNEELVDSGGEETASDEWALTTDTYAEETVTSYGSATPQLGAKSKSAPAAKGRRYLDLRIFMKPGSVWDNDAEKKCAEGSASSGACPERMSPTLTHAQMMRQAEGDVIDTDDLRGSDGEPPCEGRVTDAIDTAAESVTNESVVEHAQETNKKKDKNVKQQKRVNKGNHTKLGNAVAVETDQAYKVKTKEKDTHHRNDDTIRRRPRSSAQRDVEDIDSSGECHETVDDQITPSGRELILEHRIGLRDSGLMDAEKDYILKRLHDIQRERADYKPSTPETESIIEDGKEIGALVDDTSDPSPYFEKVRDFIQQFMESASIEDGEVPEAGGDASRPPRAAM